MTNRRKRIYYDEQNQGQERAIDPTENVKELVALSNERLDDLRILERLRQDDAREAESYRINERYNIMEKHRLEIEAKDALIGLKESERINAVAAVEKASTAAQFTEQKGALALATTAADLKASALVKEQAATAGALASSTAANTARGAISTPLLMLLSTLGGAIILYMFEHLTALSPVAPIVVK